MKREEAIRELQSYADASWGSLNEAFELAIKALHPVSREEVEKVWKGKWLQFARLDKCTKCGYETGRGEYGNNFCPACGRAMTDEAVQMVMRRLGALE